MLYRPRHTIVIGVPWDDVCEALRHSARSVAHAPWMSILFIFWRSINMVNCSWHMAPEWTKPSYSKHKATLSTTPLPPPSRAVRTKPLLLASQGCYANSVRNTGNGHWRLLGVRWCHSWVFKWISRESFHLLWLGSHSPRVKGRSPSGSVVTEMSRGQMRWAGHPQVASS